MLQNQLCNRPLNPSFRDGIELQLLLEVLGDVTSVLMAKLNSKTTTVRMIMTHNT